MRMPDIFHNHRDNQKFSIQVINFLHPNEKQSMERDFGKKRRLPGEESCIYLLRFKIYLETPDEMGACDPIPPHFIHFRTDDLVDLINLVEFFATESRFLYHTDALIMVWRRFPDDLPAVDCHASLNDSDQP